jgi:hypothetical protein
MAGTDRKTETALDAEKLLRERAESFLQQNGAARQLAGQMREETGTDFFDWIDHLALAPEDEKTLRELGFVSDPVQTPNGQPVLKHPGLARPRVVLEKGAKRNPAVVALRAESVADFAAANWLTGRIEGDALARMRRVAVSEEDGARLEAVERNGYRGFAPAPLHPADLKSIIRVKDLWRTRPRHCATEAAGFEAANKALEEILTSAGPDLAGQFFFQEERRYWEGRNRAAQLQKRRQDRLGLGWGNDAHHTFFSSREYFVDLIQFLLRLGFEKRERYYAGAEAGWGAQVCEQPNLGIAIFARLDLTPEDGRIDFSTTRLPPAPRLGKVGLWTGLHGESFLEAGLHDLRARFDFEAEREPPTPKSAEAAAPLPEFEAAALKGGERWPVRRERAEKLLQAGLITAEECEQFLREGAPGSRLENGRGGGGPEGVS